MHSEATGEWGSFLRLVSDTVIAVESNVAPALIPAPASFELADGAPFMITSAIRIIAPEDDASTFAANYLADALHSRTSLQLAVAAAAASTPEAPEIRFELAGTAKAAPEVAIDNWVDESYEVTVTATAVVARAATPVGLLRAATTLGHLAVGAGEDWQFPATTIKDAARYTWRGLSMDISRSFYPLPELKQIVDLLVDLKLNVLHLHLTDDQGWRLEIKRYPELTEISGATAVDGGRSGFLTQEDYKELVAYAAQRHVTVIPEIDIPGHTHAILHAIDAADVDNKAPQPYTGVDVGFSELRLDIPEVRQIFENIIEEVAAITAGPYIHIGGDEALATPDERFNIAIDVAERAAAKYGKIAVGWNETARAAQMRSTVVQQWDPRSKSATLVSAAQRGNRVVLSPANNVYLDMKYHAQYPLGQDWIGYVELDSSYMWEPTETIAGLPEQQIVGIEAGMWTEKIHTLDQLMTMLLPRLAAVAEIAWTPRSRVNWQRFLTDVAVASQRWEAAGWPVFRSPHVPWPDSVD